MSVLPRSGASAVNVDFLVSFKFLPMVTGKYGDWTVGFVLLDR